MLGQEIKVEHLPNLLKEFDCYGDWTQETNTIRVQSPNPDQKIPMDICFQAYMHEVLHACLDGMGSDLSDDESFVESLSQVLYQAEKSRKYG